MLVRVQLTINASKEAIWAAITDIENAVETIRGIEKSDCGLHAKREAEKRGRE